VERNSHQVIASRGEIDFGFADFAETEPEFTNNQPDNNFVRFLGQFHWLQSYKLQDPFNNNKTKKIESLFKVNLQLANKHLLPVSQFSAGGISTVRGYRENTFIRDNGITSSLELRIPISKFNLPRMNNNSLVSNLSLVPFFDYAYVWDTNNDIVSNQKIYSVGLGLQWRIDKKLAFDIYWAKDLRKLDVEYNDNLQDKGIHLQMRLNLL